MNLIRKTFIFVSKKPNKSKISTPGDIIVKRLKDKGKENI